MQANRKLHLVHLWNGPTIWDLDAYLILDRIQRRLTMQDRFTSTVHRRTWAGWVNSRKDKWGTSETVVNGIPAVHAVLWDLYEQDAEARAKVNDYRPPRGQKAPPPPPERDRKPKEESVDDLVDMMNFGLAAQFGQEEPEAEA
jgi:hypothetical protein